MLAATYIDRTQTVTVTILGTDNPAVVWIAASADSGTTGGQWSNKDNWETGTVPVATDDVIVVTNQLLNETPVFPATIDSETNAVGHSLTLSDFDVGAFDTPPTVDNQGTLTIGTGGISLNNDGSLTFDASSLDATLNSNYSSVAGFFQNANSWG